MVERIITPIKSRDTGIVFTYVHCETGAQLFTLR